MGAGVNRTILVLLDGLPVRREAISYSVELARRVDARIQFLLLSRCASSEPVRPGAESAEPGTRIDGAGAGFHAGAFLEEIRRAGLEAEWESRSGDAASELLKYLAESQPFLAVVWGGGETYLRQKKALVRHHWLERVRGQIQCPLVFPSLKKQRSEIRLGKQRHA
ncbi:MAG: universal stress protein [bacterium]